MKHEEATKFLSLLDPNATHFTFQTFDDLRSRSDKSLARTAHGTLDECIGWLEAFNGKGAGVFVTVNETSLEGRRSNANTIRCRAVWQDDDEQSGNMLGIEPSIEVRSSEHKHQRYWLTTTDDMELSDTVQKRMNAYGHDKGANGLCRVLRLPSFNHMKDPENPWMVTFTGEGEQYDFDTLVRLAAPVTPVKQEVPSFVKSSKSNILHNAMAGLSDFKWVLPEFLSAMMAYPVPADNSGRYVFANAVGSAIHQHPADKEAIRDAYVLYCETNMVEGIDDHEYKGKLQRAYEEAAAGTNKTPYGHIFKQSIDNGWTKQLLAMSSVPLNKTAVELFHDYILTDDDVKDIKGAEFIIDDMVIKGHIAAFVGAPGCGKTALLSHLAKEIAVVGHTLLYFNFDAGAAELAAHQARAKRDGYIVVAPTMKTGVSIKGTVAMLNELNNVSDASNVVVILDTLKKCVKVMGKDGSADFYGMLRSLTGKGLTVLIAAHTNKRREDDDNLMFEGVGDLLSDVDELIYLEYDKQVDASVQTITTYVDPVHGAKVRGFFEQTSYSLDLVSREVVLLDEVVDVKAGAAAKLTQELTDKDGRLEGFIKMYIEEGAVTQTALVEKLSIVSPSRRKTLAVLKWATSTTNPDAWLEIAKGDKNSNIYSVIPAEGVGV